MGAWTGGIILKHEYIVIKIWEEVWKYWDNMVSPIYEHLEYLSHVPRFKIIFFVSFPANIGLLRIQFINNMWSAMLKKLKWKKIEKKIKNLCRNKILTNQCRNLHILKFLCVNAMSNNILYNVMPYIVFLMMCTKWRRLSSYYLNTKNVGNWILVVFNWSSFVKLNVSEWNFDVRKSLFN